MRIIGLTGTIGAGKSTVIRWLAEHGACTVDADRLAHEAMQPGQPAWQPVVDAFGASLVQADGTIDRAALGRIVFADPERLKVLESIVHPAVYALFAERVAACNAEVLVVEAIKLIESGRLLPFCDEVWLVTISEDVQLARLLATRGMSAEEARRRIANQMPQAEKWVYATRVIDNNGSPADLETQLIQIWSDLAVKYGLTLHNTRSGAPHVQSDTPAELAD